MLHRPHTHLVHPRVARPGGPPVALDEDVRDVSPAEVEAEGQANRPAADDQDGCGDEVHGGALCREAHESCHRHARVEAHDEGEQVDPGTGRVIAADVGLHEFDDRERVGSFCTVISMVFSSGSRWKKVVMTASLAPRCRFGAPSARSAYASNSSATDPPISFLWSRFGGSCCGLARVKGSVKRPIGCTRETWSTAARDKSASPTRGSVRRGRAARCFGRGCARRTG